MFQDLRNTVGNIPFHWYDDCEHFGYDIDGNPIKRVEKKDEIDSFLEKMEDPDYWFGYFMFFY